MRRENNLIVLHLPSHVSRYIMTNTIKNGISNYIHHLKLFSKNARLFLLGAFFIGLAFAGFQLLLNLYLKELSFGERKMLDTAKGLLVKEISIAKKMEETKVEENIKRIFKS